MGLHSSLTLSFLFPGGLRQAIAGQHRAVSVALQQLGAQSGRSGSYDLELTLPLVYETQLWVGMRIYGNLS